MKLKEAGFVLKERERLTELYLLKFNGSNIILEGNALVLTQER
jgi:hypothetical protein